MRFLKLSLCLVVVLLVVGSTTKQVSDHRKSEEIMLRSQFRVPPDAYDVRYWREVSGGWLTMFEATGVKFRLPHGKSPDHRLKQLADAHGSGDHRENRFLYRRPGDYTYIVTYDPNSQVYEVTSQP